MEDGTDQHVEQNHLIDCSGKRHMLEKFCMNVWLDTCSPLEVLCTTTSFICHDNAESNLEVCHGKNRMIGGFSIPECASTLVSQIQSILSHIPNSSAGLSFDLQLQWIHNVLVCEKYYAFLLQFFSFKTGLSIAWHYLTISLYKLSDFPSHRSALRNMWVFWLLVMAADWK